MSNVAHLLEQLPAKPGSDFLSCNGVTWTYDAVVTSARRIAALLHSRGVQRGDRIALHLENGPEFVCAYFGILRLGAIAVALPASLKNAEAQPLLADSGCRLVFTGADGGDKIAPPQQNGTAPWDVVVLKANAPGQFSPSLPDDDHRSIVELDPADPAAIVYSSGTEGTPKGVLLSHANVEFTATAKRRYMGVRENDRLLLFLPLHHCFGQNAVMNAAAASGACLIIQRRFDPMQVLQAVAYDGATMFFGVPTVFSALLDLAEPSQLAGLRYFFSAAAPLPPAIEQHWLARFGHPIHQGYGMTESSPFATYNHAERIRPGTVGTAIDGVQIHIVDPLSGAELPPGTQGEVTISGPNIMLGYWNQPDATARTVRNGRLHTGDLGRLDADGYLTIDDRLKDIIVVGGSNVSPVEVEKTLCRNPAIREAAVYGAPEPYLGEEVRAAVVLRPNQTASETDILAALRPLLAAYKVPAAVQIVDSLPKSPTGKILRRVLRDAARAASPPQPARVDATSLRAWLDEWLAGKLGVRARGIDLDRPLLDYGLDSIAGVALARDVSAYLGWTVAPTLVWEQPTLRALLHACGANPLSSAATH